MGSASTLHRAFHAYPCQVADKDGVILDLETEMAQLSQDLESSMNLVEWLCDWDLL